jgi:uncharacterized protein (TIGR02145 family)
MNSAVLFLFSASIMMFQISCSKNSNNGGTTSGNCIDASGNSYKTVQIGSQLWMAENLRSKIFQNGDPLVDYVDPNNTLQGIYYNKSIVLDSRNIAPEGWRIATRQDYELLFSYLGGSTISKFYKLFSKKEWCQILTDSITNSTNFNLYPQGTPNSDCQNSFLLEGGGYRLGFNTTLFPPSGTYRFEIPPSFSNYRYCSIRCIKE